MKWISFHTVLWNELCDFITPSLWILFITCEIRKEKRKKMIQIYQVLLQILPLKARQSRHFIYDVITEYRRLSLLKSCPSPCHKLIHEIAIFHSINGKHVIKWITFNDLYIEEIVLRIIKLFCLRLVWLNGNFYFDRVTTRQILL